MNKRSNIIHYKSKSWEKSVTILLNESIENILTIYNRCSVMLTGGETMKRIYDYWTINPPNSNKKVVFYFGDERAVSPEDSESNFWLAKNHFVKNNSFINQIFRMETEMIDLEQSAILYEKILPESIDILLLTLGEDGHIASIFPNSILFDKNTRKVMPIIAPKIPSLRLTITPFFIKSAKNIFLFVRGASKGKILARSFIDTSNIKSLPVRLVLNGNLIMDDEAYFEFKNYTNNE